ncbi:MAG: UDP-2,3-diacylglucosamine diphosphatase [Phycisphaerae bacterium]|nr:UDP-2,3-diacylglucosamine diphosphatase [Phycisphaerae bacterium]
MGKTYYRSVFISDTHLCCRDSHAEMLLRFLDSFKCEHLYLVGDIVDAWYLGKKVYWPATYNKVMRKLLKHATRGTKVVYIPGNHDELARHLAGYSLGNVVIASKVYHFTADGKKLLVVHGDQFDAIVTYHVWLSHLGGAAYDYLIAVNRMVNAVRQWLGLPYMSLAGAIRRKVKGAVKFLTRFEDTLIEMAKQEGVDGVICGHIHQPAIKESQGVMYLNSGDWIENCSAVVEDPHGNFEIVRAHELFDHRDEVTLPEREEQSAVALTEAHVLSALISSSPSRSESPDEPNRPTLCIGEIAAS